MTESRQKFDEAVAASAAEPVIMYFSAPWCGPCKTFKPVIERQCGIAMRTIYSFSVDEDKDLAAELGIRGVPTAIRYENGVETNRVVGALSEGAAGTFVG